MKKAFCLLFILLLVPCLALADEEFPLNDFEQNFVGGWVMYATLSDGTVCHYTLTFTEDRSVFLRTLTVKNGKADYNTLSSGQWCEFMSKSIYLTLSGKAFVSQITEDDILKLIEFDTMTGSGFFTRCPDMGYTFGK